MQTEHKNETCGHWDWNAVQPTDDKDLQVQLVIALALGAVASLTFCFIRPRWPELYAARKRRLDHTLGLPTLSNSFFGWIPQLHKITEEQVLASAGLDAFVFLRFFKMSTRLFGTMAFLATIVLLPINSHFRGSTNYFGGGKGSHGKTTAGFFDLDQSYLQDEYDDLAGGGEDMSKKRGFLWSYVIFTYLFVGLTIYTVNWETFRIIRYRQDYLGSQSTVTDRTFRLTGIPADLRSEDKIKHLIEKLDIGTVDKVTVCRDWKELDRLVYLRDKTLRRLEAAWADYLRYQEKKAKNGNRSNQSGTDSSRNETQEDDIDQEAGENGRLINGGAAQSDDDEQGRPKVNIRYGVFGFRSRNVDAMDYYEESLRRLDAKIIEARKKTYKPTDMAIVTMDTVASCQMAIQARIDPRPGQLLTKPTPAPSDLVWSNTYAPRGLRRLKSWAVTIFISILTIVFIFPTAALASLMSFCAIKRVVPSFAEWLARHSIIYSLVKNTLPTAVVSLLNILVPYFFDWLSNCQGMISQGDVELSVISKNFFFTFFNTFFVFAISRTGADFLIVLQDWIKDTSKIPAAIAKDVERLSIFYICFILLQGVGLMPFRILEAGSMFLTPIYRWMSKTPRDFEELKAPPVFQYGFYLPTALLVFNLCIIYSVLQHGFLILITGTIYFALGAFAYKYMVLYAMDQPQHATGGAWRIICQRIVLGLVVFEVVMIGQIALLSAFVQSVIVAPLIPFTVWYSYYIKQRFEPLTIFIALRAIRANEDSDDAAVMDETFADEDGPRPSQGLLRRGSTLDEYKEKGLRFVNPSLVAPLPQPWIYKDPPPPIPIDGTESTEEHEAPILQGVDSIADANVWRDNNESNV